MIWLTYLLILAAAVMLASIAVPADLRALVAENCRDAQGRLRLGYAAKELGSLASFFGWLGLAVLFCCAIPLLPLRWMHDRWIPLEIAVEASARFHPDPDTWRQRLAGPPDDLIQRHRQWVRAQGGTRAEVHQIQSLLWSAIPLGVLLAAISAWLSVRWIAKGYRTGIEQWAEVAFARRTARLTAHYLQDAEQRRQRAVRRTAVSARRP